jgi:kinesin family protein C1
MVRLVIIANNLGSGKTYTMEGAVENFEENAGMIPRAVEQIYTAAEKLAEQGWEYKMDAQFLEIYNETLRDLLSESNEQKKHEIKHDSSGKTTVTDTTICMVLLM